MDGRLRWLVRRVLDVVSWYRRSPVAHAFERLGVSQRRLVIGAAAAIVAVVVVAIRAVPSSTVAPPQAGNALSPQLPLAQAVVAPPPVAAMPAVTAAHQPAIAVVQSSPDLPKVGELPRGCGRWVSSKKPAVAQPHQAKSAWHMARKSLQAGNLAKTEELLCLSVSMSTTGPGVVGLIRFHFAQNNMDAATRWAEWAAGELPDDPVVKQMLADVRHRQGRVDEARALLHSAMSVSAADVHVLRQVALKYARSGYKALKADDPGQAERLFRRSLTLDTQNARASAGLSEIALRQGDVEAALRYAATAVSLNPRSFEGQLALGDAHAEKREPEAAKSAWLEAARLRPKARAPRRRLGL